MAVVEWPLEVKEVIFGHSFTVSSLSTEKAEILLKVALLLLLSELPSLLSFVKRLELGFFWLVSLLPELALLELPEFLFLP